MSKFKDGTQMESEVVPVYADSGAKDLLQGRLNRAVKDVMDAEAALRRFKVVERKARVALAEAEG